MALVVYDRVLQTGTANTTVSFSLSGTVTGYQSFAVVGNANTTYYAATDGTNWETGLGTYTSAGTLLTRTTVSQSSNSNTAVTFSGTVSVWIDYLTSFTVFQGGVLGTPASGTLTNCGGYNAGSLAGATIASGVTASSLTSFGTSPTLVTPVLGTPTSGTLTNCSGFNAGSLAGATLASGVTASSLTSVGSLGSTQISSLGVGTAASGTGGEIRATNNVTAYYSDDNLKTKLGKIENALDKVCALEGFYYEANETAQALGYEVKREVGLSAQSTQKEMPEIVAPAPISDKYLTIRYERYAPYFVEAIKELRKEIEELKRNK